MKHVKELIRRFDLLLLPKELDRLVLDRKYDIEKIYIRLRELGSLPEWTTLQAFRLCCHEYEEQGLGFKVEGGYLMRVKQKDKSCT